MGIMILGFMIFGLGGNVEQKLDKANITLNVVDKEKINEIKHTINATADADLYQMEEEYDGRQILQIKPSIQFETVLAGILKKGKPLEEEVQTLLANKPTQNGVWISEQTRERFLVLLQENGITNYQINQEGYLQEIEKSDNEEAKKIKEAIHANKKYRIDISGTSYIRDEFSGEIVEYPFEKMEPFQVMDVYEYNDTIILEVTTNEKGKLSNQEILKEILMQLK